MLIAAILDDTFADDVLAGWTRAAATFASTDEGSAGWLRPLAEHWINAQDRQKGAERKRAIEHVESLLAVMPTADAEAVVGQLLETTARSDDLEALGLLQHLRRPWSVGFSRAYLARAADVLKRSDARAYNWAATLSTAAAALEPLTFDAALALCATTEPQPGSWHSQAASREVERFAAVVSARRSFYAEIASQGDLHRV